VGNTGRNKKKEQGVETVSWRRVREFGSKGGKVMQQIIVVLGV